MLREIMAVYKREIKAYFTSPAIYVVIGLFLAFVGWQFYYLLNFFVNMSDQAQNPQMSMGMPPVNITEIVVRSMFGLISFLLMFIIPMLTMRLFSEEKRLGTFELLVTCPLRDWSILLGKFFAAFTVGFVIWLFCLIYPVITQWVSANQAETPVIVVSNIGLLFIIAAYVAFGVFASSLTENQMLSAILTFVGLLVFWIIGRMDMGAGKTWELWGLNVPVDAILGGLCVLTHSENFGRGLLALSDMAFFAFFSIFFLAITAKILEARRWRV